MTPNLGRRHKILLLTKKPKQLVSFSLILSIGCGQRTELIESKSRIGIGNIQISVLLLCFLVPIC